MTDSGQNITARRAYLGLGSNMGDKIANISEAVKRLQAVEGITVVAQSSLYRTAPWGNEKQDWFVNACIGIDTSLPPERLLETCLSTERAMGRERLQKWGPRLIDIDILSYENETLSTETLSLPHPFILQRAFVLVPLAEIAPDLIIGGRSASEACKALDCTGIMPVGVT